VAQLSTLGIIARTMKHIASLILMFSLAGCSTSQSPTGTRSSSQGVSPIYDGPVVTVAEFHSLVAKQQIGKLMAAHGLTAGCLDGSETGPVIARVSEAAKTRLVIAEAIKQDGLDAVVIWPK
jgi:hypothetical protein